MQLQTFLADSAMEAVNQIRESLGPDAVVVNVRQLPGAGLSRLWSKPRVEVLAYRPEPVAAEASDSLSQLRQELAALKDQLESRSFIDPSEKQTSISPISPGLADGFDGMTGLTQQATHPLPSFGTESRKVNWGRSLDPAPGPELNSGPGNRWRIGAVLESTGLLPLHAQEVVESLRSRHGNTPPHNLGQELQLASAVLLESWRPAPSLRTNTHVFVGAAGVGKTTCLCQWLTRTTLVDGRPARVWRLDGRNANNAESLSVYAEILGVPLERHLPKETPPPEETLFVDLPGVSWTDSSAIQQLAVQLTRLPDPQVHLVLNAAYETSSLLAQTRAFAALPVSDLVFTHLDEEHRWGKLWNFVFGTKYTIGCLNAGQNVPGDFQLASPERILARQFLRK